MNDPSGKPTRSLRWRAGGFRGTVHPDWQSIFDSADPLAWIARTSVEALSDRPSSRVNRCQTDRGIVFAKVMTAATDKAVLGRAVLPRLKWALRWSRAGVTMRTSRRMERAGIHCAPIVLAARKRSGLGATDVLISAQVIGESLLNALQREESPTARSDLLQSAAHAIRHMHEHGFMHGDLHPNNIVLEGPHQSVCFIDNDRTRHWPTGLPWVFRKRNLEQMVFRILRIDDLDPVPFLDAYLTGVSPAQCERTKRAVLKKAQLRVKQFYVHYRPEPDQAQSTSS